ncbi:MAG: hypothetical protein ACRCY9_05815, partial [Phycicoccus sp.]
PGTVAAESTGSAAPPAAADQAVEVAMVHLVDEDDIPLTWDPVPVPRPTYTMKAKAERAETVPAAVSSDPMPVAIDGDDRPQQRRVAGA